MVSRHRDCRPPPQVWPEPPAVFQGGFQVGIRPRSMSYQDGPGVTLTKPHHLPLIKGQVYQRLVLPGSVSTSSAGTIVRQLHNTNKGCLLTNFNISRHTDRLLHLVQLPPDKARKETVVSSRTGHLTVCRARLLTVSASVYLGIVREDFNLDGPTCPV